MLRNIQCRVELQKGKDLPDGFKTGQRTKYIFAEV